MSYSKHLLLAAIACLSTSAFAQTTPKSKEQVKQQPVKTQKQLTPQERKKAAVKRTLKEKKFRLPDTTTSRNH